VLSSSGGLIAATLDGRAPATVVAAAYHEWLAEWFSTDSNRQAGALGQWRIFHCPHPEAPVAEGNWPRRMLQQAPIRALWSVLRGSCFARAPQDEGVVGSCGGSADAAAFADFGGASNAIGRPAPGTRAESIDAVAWRGLRPSVLTQRRIGRKMGRLSSCP
jgi:hypothetical protein